MRVVLLAVCLSASIAFAQSPVQTEIFALQQQIASIQQEQQTVFQQFQMLQTFKRDEQQAANPQVIENSPIYSQDNPPPNYDDIVREKQARQDRIKQYTSDLNALFERHRALEQQKQALIARLRALTQTQ